MKLTGGVLVFAALTALGEVVSLQLKKRQRILEAVLALLGSMKIDFEYSALPLERIVAKYADEKAFSPLSFLPRCFESFQNGKDFPLAWKNAVENMSELSFDEKAKLTGLGNLLGTSSAKEQINIICTYEKYFEDYFEKAKITCEKYCKTAVTLGFFSGFAVFVLLI